jgi:hypothetical protein
MYLGFGEMGRYFSKVSPGKVSFERVIPMGNDMFERISLENNIKLIYSGHSKGKYNKLMWGGGDSRKDMGV